jgi:hypothetical protein
MSVASLNHPASVCRNPPLFEELAWPLKWPLGKTKEEGRLPFLLKLIQKALNLPGLVVFNRLSIQQPLP